MALITTAIKGAALSVAEMDANLAEIERRTGAGWRDITAGMVTDGVNPANLPVKEAFAPSGLRTEYVFDVNDYAFVDPIHINHDIKIGGKCHIHIHWSTNGTNAQPVKWEFQISRAKGHDQEFFDAGSSYYVMQAPNQVASGAWRHYVAEISALDALTLTEPDELILVTVRRVTNGGTDNTDKVFGITVDAHYESDRDTSPNKSPSFYA